MKKNKKAKRHSFKRNIMRFIYVLEIPIIIICVCLTVYIILCEQRVITPSFTNQMEEEEFSEKDIQAKKEQEYSNQSKTEHTIKEEIELNLEPEDTSDTKAISIETIGEVEQENIEIVEEQLKQLPIELVNAFVEDENQWKFYMTDEDIRDKYYGGIGSRCMAITIYDYHRIEIENRKEAAEEAPIHEMGHFLDYIIKKMNYLRNYPSLSPEFLKIYAKERKQFIENIKNGNSVSDSREFFAETFYYYVTDSSKCTPEAANYIQSQLNILKKQP